MDRLRAAPGQLRWCDARRVPAARIPAGLRAWLLADGSLTRRLIEASRGAFGVRRLAQTWQRPTLAEARLLGVDPAQRALVREVVLNGCGQPWVYARSVLPVATLGTGPLRRLRYLQEAPLGALLFTFPQLRRRPFELTICDDIWGRRSRFEINGLPLIVSEFFLPEFVARLCPDVAAVAD